MTVRRGHPPELVGWQLSGGCGATHLELERRGPGLRARSADPRRRAKEHGWPESGPGKARSPGRLRLGIPAGGAGRRAARRALAARRDPGGGWLPRRPGFPEAGSAQLNLARRHRGRRLGLAACRGDERRGRFLGEPRALPIKPPQEAKSKSQSPSLQTRRHPISWETATPNDKPRIFSLAHGGETCTALRGGPGTSGPILAHREPLEDRMRTQALPRGHPPNRWALELGASRQAAAARRRRVLTWIPQSWKLAGGSSAPAFPLSPGDAARNSKIKSPPNTSVVFKYSRGRLPRQGPPRPRGGLREMEVGRGRGGSFPPPHSICRLSPFSSWCRTQPVIFSTEVKQQLCKRRFGERCYVGFRGFLKLKIKGGCLSNCCLLWA